MDNLLIEATKYTPHISFNAETNILDLKGETYPENTAEFYAPVFSWLEEYLQQLGDQAVRVNMEIIYFNSSSSKVLMDLFDRFEEAVNEGKQISINWIYDKEDDSALEYGEEFQEDLEVLQLNLVEKTG
jgi:SiaC family regulatory phosphoprotein